MVQRSLIALFLASGLFLAGCNELPSTSLSQSDASPSPAGQQNQDPQPLVVDAELVPPEVVPPDSPFWKEIFPEYQLGMAWEYDEERDIQGEHVRAWRRLEVTAVTEDTVTYHVDFQKGDEDPISGDYEVPLNQYGGYLETGPYTFTGMGTESVTVLAGTFPNAAKLFRAGTPENLTWWVVKGVGVVKEQTEPTTDLLPPAPRKLELREVIFP